MNTIIIELCAEDRARLDGILSALQQVGHHDCKSCVQTAVNMTKDLATAAAAPAPAQERTTNAAEHPVDEVSPHADPAPAEEPEAAAQQITLDDIRAIVQRLIGPGSNKREKAQAIVKDYAIKISAIPVEKYSEVMARLIALEKEAN